MLSLQHLLYGTSINLPVMFQITIVWKKRKKPKTPHNTPLKNLICNHPKHIQTQTIYLSLRWKFAGYQIPNDTTFALLLWPSCFTSRLHVFTPIWRSFAAQTLPTQFKNSLHYSNALKQWQQILTGIFENHMSLLSHHTSKHSPPLFLCWAVTCMYSVLCY